MDSASFLRVASLMFASRAMDLCEVSEAAGEFQRLNSKLSFKKAEFLSEK